MGARRHFSPQQKVAILKKHLIERVVLSDLCERYVIHPTVFYRWQKAFFEKGHLAFENSEGKSSKAEKKIVKLEQKLVNKNEVLSELMEEHVAAIEEKELAG